MKSETEHPEGVGSRFDFRAIFLIIYYRNRKCLVTIKKEFYEKFPLSFELHAFSTPFSQVIELYELADVCRFFLDVLE